MKKINKNVLNDCKLNERELEKFERVFGSEEYKEKIKWHIKNIPEPFFINDNGGDWSDDYEFLKDELLPAYKENV